MRQVLVFRRAERRGWPLDLPNNSDRKSPDYRRPLLCNINNDHRRNLRQWVAPQANDGEEVRPPDGTALTSPRVGEIAPEAPKWPESHHPRLRSVGAGLAGSDTPVDSMIFSDLQTPKRTRAAEKGKEFAETH